ncbi:uncharacterized protein G2W53_016175 [Senna tora]|uniref:Uncharacterized protein n=1 Tax=Senna tora TaxID=362788 RepID=A0A834WWV7_9FABA|nr:uncharacterized protein G2W53_016175 [Senna tora]
MRKKACTHLNLSNRSLRKKMIDEGGAEPNELVAAPLN